MDINKVRQIFDEAIRHFEENNLHIFEGMDYPLICVSDVYCGVWLEHVGDAVVYAEMFPNKGLKIAENTIRTFIKYQKNGQYPCYIWDNAKSKVAKRHNVGYGQIQECVSFGSLCLRVYNLIKDDNFLKLCCNSLEKWVEWIQKYRMTGKRGLPEMFVGFDTGHDNSGRLDGMKYPENRRFLWMISNASKPPKASDKVAPISAVDMGACLFGNYISLAKMNEILDKKSEQNKWLKCASELKSNIIKWLWNGENSFFYDIDKYGNQRKYLSCSILTLFQEGVLDISEDKEMIDRILNLHLKNPSEFWTDYPFPSMAICDPSTKIHKVSNDWGYFTQGNTALRTTYWMDRYNLSLEQDYIAKAWLEAWTKAYDNFPLGQELDPKTGIPSPSSPWYSTGMLFYFWSAKRLFNF